MKKYTILLILSLFLISQKSIAQKTKTDANVFGHVVCQNCDEHLSFASIEVIGKTIGTTTDETGHFQLINLPEGTHIIKANYLGFKSKQIKITIANGETKEVNFELEEDAMGIDEIVVSADRSEQKRTEAPIIVNTISPNLFNSSQSLTLGEGLNFSPGLRLENNCQNCGFSQVRMNGMEGPYSQILINSRPLFSGLAGVYGLELIPANMIEKVEVVRGGGSALFGSNAIAGTINIILKDPKTNSYEAGANYAVAGIGKDNSGGTAPDYSINFNTSIVSDDHKSGVTLYGYTRKREMFDANNDSFSEIAPLENLTFGARTFHRFGHRDKLAIDFFAIKEQRDGGNLQSYPLHQREIGEVLTHNMKVASTTYERYFREYDQLSIYTSGQFLERDSYYGAGFSTSDYGFSKDNTYNLGLQYKAYFGKASLIGGVENTSGFLTDKKLGTPIFGTGDEGETIITGNNPHTIVSDQSSVTTGTFAQYDIQFNRIKASVGARFDHYEIKDYANENEKKTGNVFSPRLSVMYGILNELQARVSYSQGYRAPQIFDEDLHIETSGSRQVIHENDPNLKQETSHSIMASLDLNKLVGTVYTGFLIEGFYTKLVDAFANEYGDQDENGTVIYTRVNSGGALVQGVNMELRLKPLKKVSFTSGLTIQTSKFNDPDEDFNEKRFFRTPDQYGFFALDWDFYKNFCFSTTGNYTGSMLVPYFGTENPDGELRESDRFFDLGAKLSYIVKLNGASIEFSSGIKNIFDSYQNDFDSSIDRDPAYIYGPLSPRTIYFGIKFGNLLK
jgi:outer membrane receptor for ferrienterochelin and colicins